MPLLKIGVRTTTGLAHWFASLSGSPDSSAALTGTLVPAVWKSAIFWNVSTRDRVHWTSFVVDWLQLPKFQGLFVPGKVRNSLFRFRTLDFGVIALRVYFRRPRPPSSLAGFCSTLPDGKCYLCLYTRVLRTFRFGPISFLHVAFCPHSPLTSVIRCFSSFFFFYFFFVSCSSYFIFLFSITFQIYPTLVSNGAPEFPIRGFNPGADRQSTMQSTVLSTTLNGLIP